MRLKELLKENHLNKEAINLINTICYIALIDKVDIKKLNKNILTTSLKDAIDILEQFKVFETGGKESLAKTKESLFNGASQATAGAGARQLVFRMAAAVNSMMNHYNKKDELKTSLDQGIDIALIHLKERLKYWEEFEIREPIESTDNLHKRKVGMFTEGTLKPYLPTSKKNKTDNFEKNNSPNKNFS